MTTEPVEPKQELPHRLEARGEARLSPVQEKIRDHVNNVSDVARQLADREFPGVTRHVIAHEKGGYTTEIYGLQGKGRVGEPDGPLQVGRWRAESISVRYPSNEAGEPIGVERTVHIDLNNLDSSRMIEKPGVDNGKMVFDNRISLSLDVRDGSAPSSYSTVLRNGNFHGDRGEYNDQKHDVVKPIDAAVQAFLERGQEFVTEHPEVTNDLVERVAAERARELLEAQQQARAEVERAQRGPQYEEPASWRASDVRNGEQLASVAAASSPRPRDGTGYAVDQYTSGRIVQPQQLSRSFLEAYPMYDPKNREQAPHVTKKKGVRHHVNRFKGAVKKFRKSK